MRDHFPFWRPIATVLLLVVIPAALFFGAKYYTAALWGDPAHARAECRAAAGIATTILRTKQLVDPAASKSPVQFDPVLRGAPAEQIERRLPHWLEGLRAFLLMPQPLDCTAEFKGLPLLRRSENPDALVTRFFFSRLLFGVTDGTVAYASIDDVCGNLCGNGWQTAWRRKGNVWQLERVRMLWIS